MGLGRKDFRIKFDSDKKSLVVESDLGTHKSKPVKVEIEKTEKWGQKGSKKDHDIDLDENGNGEHPISLDADRRFYVVNIKTKGGHKNDQKLAFFA